MFDRLHSKTDEWPHGYNAKCPLAKTSQMQQHLEQSNDDSPHLSWAANAHHHASAYSDDLSEYVSILKQRKHDVEVKRFHQIFPTRLSYAEWALAHQIELSCPNFGKTKLSTLKNLMLLGHGVVAQFAHRQALHALRQAYQKHNRVSALSALHGVSWYMTFCLLAYRLCPKAYQYSPIIKLFKQ